MRLHEEELAVVALHHTEVNLTQTLLGVHPCWQGVFAERSEHGRVPVTPRQRSNHEKAGKDERDDPDNPKLFETLGHLGADSFTELGRQPASSNPSPPPRNPTFWPTEPIGRNSVPRRPISARAEGMMQSPPEHPEPIEGLQPYQFEAGCIDEVFHVCSFEPLSVARGPVGGPVKVSASWDLDEDIAARVDAVRNLGQQLLGLIGDAGAHRTAMPCRIH